MSHSLNSSVSINPNSDDGDDNDDKRKTMTFSVDKILLP